MKPQLRYRVTWYYCAVALTLLIVLQVVQMLSEGL